MIAIIDYKAGNLTSVKRALNSLNVDSEITNDPALISKASQIIFPGVGACGKAMADLKELGLDRVIKHAFEDKKPVLGICLGTQIIMQQSQENDTQCLGLINGKVIRFSEGMTDHEKRKLKVPHMGWNRVFLKQSHPIFEGINSKSEFYFVHAYFPCPTKRIDIVGETEHGIKFASVLGAANLVAVQFHPEKSGRPGLRMLSNFSRWDGQYNA